MGKIIDTPAAAAADNPYIESVKELLAAGEGKSWGEDAADEKDAAKITRLFQRAANDAIDRTARVKSTKNDDGTFELVFTLRPRQRTTDERLADAESTPVDETTDAESTPVKPAKPASK